jgi:short subunit dehydrogenase-like uncharacterized protein
VSSRRFDLILWGATGFTGRLVAERIARRREADAHLRWAVGGRDAGKLEALRAALEGAGPGGRDVGVVVADAGDRGSLDGLARAARVVASTVGPFWLHGRALVAACAEAGTDYCDITGEVQFVRDSIDRHHRRARETGARVVHCCGYDSVPSDLGTLVAQTAMREAGHGRCRIVKGFAGETRGGFSGGTIASVLAIAEEAERDPRVRDLLADPYALDPGRPGTGPDGPDLAGVAWDPDFHAWTGPFLGAAINARVVRRSNALLDYAYGRDFQYREASLFSRGPAGWAAAAGAAAGVALGKRVVRSAAGRAAAARALPAPGQGPSLRTRQRGRFTMHFVGIEADPAPPERPARVFVVVRGRGDPGYSETAKMLAESALCLCQEKADPRRSAGVSTPAAAMGLSLVERLGLSDIVFDASVAPEGRAN